jgi:hypothetical protein
VKELSPLFECNFNHVKIDHWGDCKNYIPSRVSVCVCAFVEHEVVTKSCTSMTCYICQNASHQASVLPVEVTEKVAKHVNTTQGGGVCLHNVASEPCLNNLSEMTNAYKSTYIKVWWNHYDRVNFYWQMVLNTKNTKQIVSRI